MPSGHGDRVASGGGYVTGRGRPRRPPRTRGRHGHATAVAREARLPRLSALGQDLRYACRTWRRVRFGTASRGKAKTEHSGNAKRRLTGRGLWRDRRRSTPSRVYRRQARSSRSARYPSSAQAFPHSRGQWEGSRGGARQRGLQRRGARGNTELRERSWKSEPGRNRTSTRRSRAGSSSQNS